MSLLKNLAAYQLVKLLATPFEKWDAFKLGLIDDDGKTLRKTKTAEDKKVFGMFQRLVRGIKQLINKAPFGVFKIASVAIALKLLKEETGHDLSDELEEFGINNKIINEQCTNYTQLGVISQGKYVDSGGNMFIIKEDIYPIDNIIQQNIYEVQHILTKKRILVTENTIKKI